MIDKEENGQQIQTNESECSGRRKEKLEAIVMKDYIPIDEAWEGLKLTKEWLQEIETDLFHLVCYLVFLTLQTEAAKSQPQEFKSELQKLKDAENGRVPIVIYRTLDALKELLSHMEEQKFGNGERGEESFRERSIKILIK